MTKELYESLEALCYMWEQYCGDEAGHCCMSAGECAEEVLDRYELLIHGRGYEARVNYEKLNHYQINAI